MSQIDIYNYLVNKRFNDDNGYYSVKDLSNALKCSKALIRKQINKLKWFGYLESINGVKPNDLFVRMKKRYLPKKTKRFNQ